MKSIQLLFIVLFFSLGLIAQSERLDHNSFTTTGSAIAAGAHCFQLTPDQTWKGGTVWYKQAISLADPFEMEMDLKFGCADEGADGMVFIFHPSLRDGFQGEGIGFGGLKPSFGIEMDTYENHHLGDPYYDHIALIKNGMVHHDRGITRPISLLPGNKNIEDCKAHRINITWNPATKNIKLSIDGNVRIDKSYDIIEDIFKGNPDVYWGISSATGGMHNRHMVCLEKLEFSYPNAFNNETQKELLKGQEYNLKNVDFLSGKTELQAYSAEELDKLVKMMKANPDFYVYINGHTDNIGSASKNKAISKKRAEEVAKYLIEKGVPKDRVKARGVGEAEPYVENDSPENRKINRRVSIFLVNPRT